jgi:hypothetical protein
VDGYEKENISCLVIVRPERPGNDWLQSGFFHQHRASHKCALHECTSHAVNE